MFKILILILWYLAWPLMVSANELEIVNIRVGQGDATLIPGPMDSSGHWVNVLFDAGDIPQLDGGNILRAVLNKRGVKELDFFILSHDDADHVAGVPRGGKLKVESFPLNITSTRWPLLSIYPAPKPMCLIQVRPSSLPMDR